MVDADLYLIQGQGHVAMTVSALPEPLFEQCVISSPVNFTKYTVLPHNMVIVDYCDVT